MMYMSLQGLPRSTDRVSLGFVASHRSPCDGPLHVSSPWNSSNSVAFSRIYSWSVLLAVFGLSSFLLVSILFTCYNLRSYSNDHSCRRGQTERCALLRSKEGAVVNSSLYTSFVKCASSLGVPVPLALVALPRFSFFNSIFYVELKQPAEVVYSVVLDVITQTSASMRCLRNSYFISSVSTPRRTTWFFCSCGSKDVKNSNLSARSRLLRIW